MSARNIAILIAVVALVLGAWYYSQPDPQTPTESAGTAAKTGAPLAEVTLPETLNANATLGKRAFEAKCAQCHGVNAAGQDGVAPPLVHVIYEPGHHGDEAFQRAAAQGVQAHHWPFGNMPPVADITRAEVGMIIAYIRELQAANGIR